MNDQVTKQETEEILRQAEWCLDIDGDWVELGCYRGDTSVLLGKMLQKNQSGKSNNIPTEIVLFVGEKIDEKVGPKVKRLWIYDSFAGLPEKTREDVSGAGANFQAGELAVTKREVIDKLQKHGLREVIVKKAWFDQLRNEDLPEKIGFAFCDGDLYESIKISLRLVLPRLAENGVIIVHDYNNPELPGSARAVDEFLRAHPEFKLRIYHTLAILTRQVSN